ncbi:MAG: PEP-CTERM sorting domain-containing protein [Opitutales bacterium]|nr:PEP-CTERM sorting domain-containing protein [Opitutales bacterium]
MKYSLIRKTALIGSLLSFASTFLSAQIVVQWGGDNDIVTSSVFGSNVYSSAVDLGTPFSLPISPAPGSGGYYNGGNPADRSAIFYGTVNNTSGGTSRRVVYNNAGLDNLGLDFSDTSGEGNTATIGGALIWQKSDGFLTNATVDFSQVTFTIDAFVNASTAHGDVRLIVRNGASDFYVSNPLFNSLWGVAPFNAGVADESLLTSWSVYDPTTDIFAIGAGATPTLDDITAIGFVYSRTADNTTFANFRLNEFTVAIPEPSTYAAIFGLTFLGLAIWRSKRRR